MDLLSPTTCVRSVPFCHAVSLWVVVLCKQVGFMFDSAHAKTRRLFRFDRDITVPVRLVDDDPGAVQV